MGKAVAVSFEGDVVKVVQASLKGKSVSVDKVETVALGEFEEYLRKQKAGEFIVACDFKESYQDVISIPLVKEQYLKRIIETEIKKATSLDNFLFIYTVIGEKALESRKTMEVFYYAVRKEAVREIVERFYENGKSVKALYPAVFPAASLFDSQIPGEVHMGVYSSGKSRTAFFTKKGAIYFIRSYESYEPGYSDFDAQNINMTISFCFQNIRINPAAVFLMGTLSEASQSSALSTVPLACLGNTGHIRCSMETFNEFILPIASFSALKSSNIIGPEFNRLYVLKNYIKYAAVVFMALAILCGGFASYEAKLAADRKDQISSTATARAATEKVFAEYSARTEKINQYRPIVEFLNKPAPDIHKLLVLFAEIEMGDLKLDTINALLKEDQSLTVFLAGNVLSGTYTAMQDALDHMIAQLSEKGKIELKSKEIDLKEKKFTIEISYKTTE